MYTQTTFQGCTNSSQKTTRSSLSPKPLLSRRGSCYLSDPSSKPMFPFTPDYYYYYCLATESLVLLAERPLFWDGHAVRQPQQWCHQDPKGSVYSGCPGEWPLGRDPIRKSHPRTYNAPEVHSKELITYLHSEEPCAQRLPLLFSIHPFKLSIYILCVHFHSLTLLIIASALI